jgi:CRISPR-associated protein Cas2
MQTRVTQRHQVKRNTGDENLYIVAYDIAAPRRWRRVFRIMEGYGEWVQLSVFQCRLSRMRRVELKLALEEVINHAEDHVVILDLAQLLRSARGWKAWESHSRWSNAAPLSCRITAVSRRALLPDEN